MKLGNLNIDNVKLGNTQIQKVMLGNNLIWQSLTNGLVGYYPLNSNTNDFSGKGYNGTIVGAPTYETGKVGTAINFGNNININYISIADNNDFSFTNGTTDVPFTISLWVKFSGFSLIGNWLVNKRNTTSGGDEWQIIYYQNRVQFYKIQFNNRNIYQQIGSSLNPISLNTWYHLCYTDNGSGAIGSGKLYINGVLNTVINKNVGGTYTRMNNGTQPLILGIDGWSFDSNLKHKGLIDELAIWKNRELTPTEVLELYTKGNAGKPII